MDLACGMCRRLRTCSLRWTCDGVGRSEEKRGANDARRATARRAAFTVRCPTDPPVHVSCLTPVSCLCEPSIVKAPRRGRGGLRVAHVSTDASMRQPMRSCAHGHGRHGSRQPPRTPPRRGGGAVSMGGAVDWAEIGDR